MGRFDVFATRAANDRSFSFAAVRTIIEEVPNRLRTLATNGHHRSLGLILHRVLPEKHLTGGGKDMIGAVVGLVTLLSALVLGLLI